MIIYLHPSNLRLVDDAKHNQTGNGASILGRLTLGIIEVSGHSNNGMSNLLSKVSFSNFLKQSVNL